MTSLAIISEPTAEPITLAEAKTHLRVDHSDDDSYIDALITAARKYLDGNCGVLGRALITQTWELTLARFPDGDIPLPLPPLQSITSITYIDQDGASQTLATSVYAADLNENMVRLKYDQSWPDTRDVWNAVVIRFVAGYGAASAVPKPLVHAIKLMVGDLYEHRQSVVMGVEPRMVPFAVDSLIAPYRVSWV